MERLVNSVKDVQGSKVAPARTCRDLAVAHPEFEDGVYWIDPNQGSPSDAIEAYCDMKEKRTCISAKPSQVTKGSYYSGPSRRMWFGEEMDNGFVFTYAADTSQLQFLQLVSSNAYQNVTYHCRKSIAYHDAAANSHKKALIFASADDREIFGGQRRKYQYTVPVDGCKNRKNVWSKTVFEFQMDKTTRLPVEDFAVVDIGDPDQAFGLEIGPVCYS